MSVDAPAFQISNWLVGHYQWRNYGSRNFECNERRDASQPDDDDPNRRADHRSRRHRRFRYLPHWYCLALHLGMATAGATRSEEHTSELQSRGHLVCRLLLEK